MVRSTGKKRTPAPKDTQRPGTGGRTTSNGSKRVRQEGGRGSSRDAGGGRELLANTRAESSRVT